MSFDGQECPAHALPRVLVETPAPPALREERIGKETAAGMVPPVCFLRMALAFGSRLSWSVR
jgi:hypothetical protein